MALEMDDIDDIISDIDDEKSEYELKAVKLTMEGFKEEAKYYDLIIKVYKNVSKILDDSFDEELDICLENIDNNYKTLRCKYLPKFHNLDDVSESFLAGLFIETLDNLINEVKEKVKDSDR